MICYDACFSIKEIKVPTNKDMEDEKKKSDKKILQKINSGLSELFNDSDFYCFAHKYTDELELAILYCPSRINFNVMIDKIKDSLQASEYAVIAELSWTREITVKKFIRIMENADNHSYLDSCSRKYDSDLGIDYFNNRYFKITEKIVSNQEITKSEAISKASSIMADRTLFEEIDRIYATDNHHFFYGHPVHYKIQAGDSNTALTIVSLITDMLCSQSRMIGSRINIVSDIKEGAYDESDIKNLFKQSGGGAIVIECRGEDGFVGNYASSYNRVINYLAELIAKYHEDTLLFFIEDTENPGFTNELISKVTDEIDVINITEGTGDKDEAISYFIDLISKSRFRDLADNDYLRYLPEKKKVFKCTDVQQAFNKWQKEILRTKAYSAYSKCNIIKQTENRKNDCYEELQNMVGLSEIKGIVGKIIASYKIQQYRDKYGFSDAKLAKHMVFTGNPGSAKTTIARLLADVLTKEGILKSGAIVECGRADLVGKYVGWTAKIVKEKFKAASGGILFIDEAYSLVEKEGLYGDEAINTIVQEMENHRDDVIVIFAGYPEKMERFLEKNEGLRSRISFHLNFPDYNADELLEIMKCMLGDKGFITDKAAEEKCLAMFKQACQIKDFGNGRFVRNVIERAMLNQAERLINQKSKTITKDQLRKIEADDFDESMVSALKQKRDSVIGFAV